MKIKLLCATDGSRASEKAVDWAVDLTKTLSGCGLEVTLTFLTVSGIPEEGDAVHGVQVMKEAVEGRVQVELL